jgi:hypothetical protein
MFKPASATKSHHGPAAWAQALFAGSVVLAGLSVWLLATL